jgi:hypothetical protein
MVPPRAPSFTLTHSTAEPGLTPSKARLRPQNAEHRTTAHPSEHRMIYTPQPPGPLAQLVEQGTLNPKVEGSNPSRPTYSFELRASCGAAAADDATKVS